MKYIIGVSLAILILVSCSPSTDTITIGFIGPLSGSAAVFGEVERNVIQIALEEINEQGGINGKQLNVIYEDGKCVAKDAINAANKLIKIDKVSIILIDCSVESLAVGPIAQENNVLLITAYASHPDITDIGDYTFRMAHSDRALAITAANLMAQGNNQIGILTEQSDYSVGLSNEIKKNFDENNIAYAEEIVQLDTTDARAEITKLLSSNPDAFFLNPNSPSVGLAMLKQLKELGYKGKLYGNFFPSHPNLLQSSLADGIIFFSEPKTKESKEKDELFNKYKELYGEDPAYSYPAVSRYDSVYLLKQAIEQAGEGSTDIRDYLLSMDNYNGLLGMYHFDENGDIIGVTPSVNLIQNKTIIQLS